MDRKSNQVDVMKADLEKGLSDILAGEVYEFDTARIIERGRKLAAPLPPNQNQSRYARAPARWRARQRVAAAHV